MKILQPEIPTQWPGRSCGIRVPAFGEVPLSHEEVAFAIRHGLLVALENKKPATGVAVSKIPPQGGWIDRAD